MLREVVNFLNINSQGIYIDGTVGSGGHAEAILSRLSNGGKLIGIDRDIEAIERAKKRLSCYGKKVHLVHARYEEMEKIVMTLGLAEIDGILIDTGVSSEQLETPERGFSFLHNGPLDMRMDRSDGISAADIVNNYDEKDLISIFKNFGEERYAVKIARAIVKERCNNPITETAKLAEIVENVVGRREKIHPATRIFQALRIAVNNELEGLKKGLEAGLKLLKSGGRIVVITFHSLEDRIVKQVFLKHAVKKEALPEGGIWKNFEEPPVRIITKHVIKASEEEIEINPRSRSAKLRVAERI